MSEYRTKIYRMHDAFVKKIRKIVLGSEIKENNLSILKDDPKSIIEYEKTLKSIRRNDYKKSELLHNALAETNTPNIYDWDFYNNYRTLLVRYIISEQELEKELWDSEQ